MNLPRSYTGDVCRGILQTQYINLLSNMVISQGSPAM